MYQSSNQIKSSDLLNLKQQKGFSCLLHSQEEILLSSRILKLNRDGKCQERIIVLTNQAILNIAKNSSIIKAFVKKFVHLDDKYDLRRRIPLGQLYGITLTPKRSSGSFLLHVTKDHDYYYKAQHNKMLLLEAISNQYQAQTKKPLPFFFKEQKDLLKYCTFKNHIKEKKDLKPKDNPHYLDHQYFVEREFDDTQYFSECFQQSLKGLEVMPKHFFRVSIHQLKPKNLYFVLKEEENRSINATSLLKFVNLLKPTFCFFNEVKELLFTPFLPGGPLKQNLSTNIPLSKDALLFYLWQLILIVEELLCFEKLYLQLTLDTIFVKQNGYIVLDGLQKLLDTKSQNGQKLFYKIEGNPYYFPPQVITFEGFSSEIMIWKLGICAYYLYRGKYPFLGHNIKQLYSNIIMKNIEEEDPELPNFIVKMLNKDKKKRITLEDLKHHPQLEGYDWKALTVQKIKPPLPFTPNIWTGKIPAIYELRPQHQKNFKKENQKYRKGSEGPLG